MHSKFRKFEAVSSVSSVLSVYACTIYLLSVLHSMNRCFCGDETHAERVPYYLFFNSIAI